MKASQCGNTNFEIHGPNKFVCLSPSPTGSGDQSLFFDVFIAVLFQSIMWGIGTAIGVLYVWDRPSHY